jgi:uridine phosphorylase
MPSLLENKFYKEPSVFLPENLLREARRQKKKQECQVPNICILDPDGDLADYLISQGKAKQNDCWACYHSKLYSFDLEGLRIGIIPCIVGASYAVLVAEQLFVSGCEVLVSVTSAGIINTPDTSKRFALISHAIRDEGTSYHYLPPDQKAEINLELLLRLNTLHDYQECPFFQAVSWTTDAPYRETSTAINNMKEKDVVCVEMEAAALYALSAVKNYNIVCFAHLTNSMAQKEGDFEKGEHFGSLDTINLLKFILPKLKP